jgi:ribosome-binding factor A
MSARVERIASLIKREIADILRKRANDTRIGFITLTKVTVTKDLSQAFVYYSEIGSEEAKKKTKLGLQSSTKFIKGEVGKALHTKTVPELHFKYDDSLEKAAQLIDRINEISKL